MSKDKKKKSALWGILLAVAVFFIIVFMPPMEGLTVPAQRSLAIFVAALILWIAKPIPIYQSRWKAKRSVWNIRIRHHLVNGSRIRINISHQRNEPRETYRALHGREIRAHEGTDTCRITSGKLHPSVFRTIYNGTCFINLANLNRIITNLQWTSRRIELREINDVTKRAKQRVRNIHGYDSHFRSSHCDWVH